MRRLLVLCCAGIFVETAFFAVLAPLLPSLSEEFDLSAAEAGALSGSYAAGVLLLAVPGGWFAANYGPRRAVLLGLSGIAVFSPLFGFAGELWLLEVSRFMQGASGALLWSGAMSWVLAAGPDERRGALVGILVAAATVGELVGAPLGALADQIGIEQVFAAVGVLAVALFAFALTLESPPDLIAQSLGQAFQRTRGRALAISLWMVMAASVAFGVVVVMTPLRLSELGGSPLLIAGSFAIGSLIETVLGPQVGRISDRIGRSAPYRVGAVIGAVTLVSIAVLETRSLVAGSMVLFAFAAGLAFTPSMAMATDAATERGLDQGYTMGFVNVAFGGGQMLGALAAGALAIYGYIVPALIGACLLLIAAMLAGRTGLSR